MDHALVDRARHLAREVLAPTAAATDRADRIPVEVLDALAAAGLHGLAAPTAVGGLGADPDTFGAVVETLAGGCLTTAFTWLQHLGPSVAVAASSEPVHDAFARDLASGAVRAGVAFAHLRRPDPPVLRAAPTGDGWRLDGTAPWVTGWGQVDVVLVGARHDDDVVWLLVDAVDAATLRTERIELAVVHASATVVAHLDAHPVPAARFVAREPIAAWRARDALGLRPNGSLALGVAAAAAADLAPATRAVALDAVAAARASLDAATTEGLPAARAAAARLALDLTTGALAAGGGGAMRRGHPVERRAREALFLVVQGQTDAIRAAQARALTDRLRESHTAGGAD